MSARSYRRMLERVAARWQEPLSLSVVETSTPAERAAELRARPVEQFLGLAELVVDSDSVLRIYAACEFGELSEDGRLWIAGIVRETMAQQLEGRS